MESKMSLVRPQDKDGVAIPATPPTTFAVESTGTTRHTDHIVDINKKVGNTDDTRRRKTWDGTESRSIGVHGSVHAEDSSRIAGQIAIAVGRHGNASTRTAS